MRVPKLHSILAYPNHYPGLASGEQQAILRLGHMTAEPGDRLLVQHYDKDDYLSSITLELTSVEPHASAREIPMDDVHAAGYKNRRELNVTMKQWDKAFHHEAPVTILRVRGI